MKDYKSDKPRGLEKQGFTYISSKVGVKKSIKYAKERFNMSSESSHER